MGEFKQTSEKSHRISSNFLFGRGFHHFRASQFSTHSKARFLGDAINPMESTIRSSDKNPACHKRLRFHAID
jgi:hypothetical protein